jgi:hypothetical protein
LWTQLHSARDRSAEGVIEDAGVRALYAEIERTLADEVT